MRDRPSDYEDRHGAFFDEIRTDLDEYATSAEVTRAIDLSKATGQHFSHSALPQFFTGDLDAQIVLVHLNPGGALPTFDQLDPAGSFDDYFDAHRYFGEYMYGPASPRTHKTQFDRKQIRFLRQFRIIDFLEEETEDDEYKNLQRALDDKLQLELVPYSSPTFTSEGFTPELLQPHFDRIMAVIAAAPRRFVLFCGAVFESILADDWIVRHHEPFRLEKQNGEPTVNRSRFANLEISYDGSSIRAGLCQTWASRGIPMAAYGREVALRY